jgi:hypothetical protein
LTFGHASSSFNEIQFGFLINCIGTIARSDNCSGETLVADLMRRLNTARSALPSVERAIGHDNLSLEIKDAAVRFTERSSDHALVTVRVIACVIHAFVEDVGPNVVQQGICCRNAGHVSPRDLSRMLGMSPVFDTPPLSGEQDPRRRFGCG